MCPGVRVEQASLPYMQNSEACSLLLLKVFEKMKLLLMMTCSHTGD